MGEPCESCRMTVTAVRRVGVTVTGEAGQDRYLGETLGGADDFLRPLPRHTAQRCRAARTLREAAEAILLPGDRLDVVPGWGPASEPPDDGWLKVRAARKHDDGRVVSSSWNVSTHPDVVFHVSEHVARKLLVELDARIAL